MPPSYKNSFDKESVHRLGVSCKAGFTVLTTIIVIMIIIIVTIVIVVIIVFAFFVAMCFV